MPMSRQTKTLETMVRMRRMVVEEARRDLLTCIQAETAAADRERAAMTALLDEQALASSPDSDDGAVEAYAKWLPVGTKTLETAREALSRAIGGSTQARARLNAARAAEEAVQRRVEAIAAAEREDALRREQLELDEAARNARRA